VLAHRLIFPEAQDSLDDLHVVKVTLRRDADRPHLSVCIQVVGVRSGVGKHWPRDVSTAITSIVSAVWEDTLSAIRWP
jgi:hypothetical protein